MLELPDWTITQERKANNFLARTLFLSSDHETFSKGTLTIAQNHIIFQIPIAPTVNTFPGIRFKENWKTLLFLEAPKNIFTAQNEEILDFLHNTCKKPIGQPKFNQNYTFQDVDSLLFLMIQEFIKINQDIKKSEDSKISIQIRFNTEYGKKVTLSQLQVNGVYGLPKKKERLQKTIHEFILSLNPEDSYHWEKKSKQTDPLFSYKKFFWDSEINNSILQYLSEDKKIKFQEIIKNFSKNSNILHGAYYE